MFGTAAAIWFAVGTVFSVPVLLSWSVVNFGLHYLSSVFPFILYYVVRNAKGHQVLACGLVTGIAVFFSYSSVVFIPVCMLWFLFRFGPGRFFVLEMLKFLTVVSIVLIPHFILRTSFDNGFNLEKLSLAEIREFNPDNLISIENLKNLPGVLFYSFPASLLLSSGGVLLTVVQRIAVLLFLGAGIYFGCRKMKLRNSGYLFPVLFIAAFLTAYALSPFYSGKPYSSNYYEYRHLTSMIPFAMMILISVFVNEGKKGVEMAGVWVMICVLSSGYYMIHTRPVQSESYRTEGWILARKYGESAQKMVQMNELIPRQAREDVIFGMGWGTAAALFSGKKEVDLKVVEELKLLYEEYPEGYREQFGKGIEMAFSEGITPVLNQEYLDPVQRIVLLTGK